MSTRSSRKPSPLAGRHVLLGVTGGIAAYKSCVLLRELTRAGATVQVVMTQAATRFVGVDTFAALSQRPVLTTLWGSDGQVPHVRAAHEADIVIIAPATANSLAKFAFGLADDVLSATVLETSAPIVVAPAMHAGMYRDPATQDNLRVLGERGMRIVGPVEGALAAGDEGIGRMVEPEDIVTEAEALLGRGADLHGVRFVVTAGPTWEPLDAVRFLGNRSTGRMGFAIAQEARLRGADVRLVVGPGTTPAPEGIPVIQVQTAAEMLGAIEQAWASTDVLVMAAAVADFRPVAPTPGKLKKHAGPPQVVLEANPDILATMGERKGDRILVGFAAETGEFLAEGRRKLDEKGADLLVVNEVGREGTGFGSEGNHAAILSRDASSDGPMDTWTKKELARALLDRVAKLRSG